MLGIKHMPCTGESGIAFSDYDRMQTHDRPGLYKSSPSWAMNDGMVRQVVVAKICRTARVKALPANLEELRTVETRYLQAVEVSARAAGAEESRKHLALVRRFGGPAAYFVALVYQRARLGRDSVAVAQHFGGVSPLNVRQQFNRLCEVARGLFPGDTWHQPRHHSWRGRGHVPARKPPVPCAFCGQPCPPSKGRARKYCDKPCRKKAESKRAKEKRARLRFCSPDCRTKYKPCKTLTNFAFQFS